MTELLSGITPANTDQRVSNTAPSENPVSTVAGQGTNAADRVVAPEQVVKQPLVRDPISMDDLADTLSRVNLTFDLFEIEAEYKIDTDENRVIITLHNNRTGKLIRRIPPDEFKENFANFREGLGMLFNGKF